MAYHQHRRKHFRLENSFPEEFAIHLQKFMTAPFIFVGSGMSKRYMNTDTWDSLLNRCTKELGLPKPYEYYKSNANNDLPNTATLIANDFKEIWWGNEQFEESRSIYQKDAQNIHSPFKYEISRLFSGVEENKNPDYNEEINLLKKITIQGIITTNWDLFLEQMFPEFEKYIGQEELLFSDISAIGEIYKIHGCSTKPESLVLTKEDYNDFNGRNPYLAAKLLTIFVEHPIIFMGYSLDDRNIQEILKSIIRCLKDGNISKLKDRLIFCQWSDDIQSTQLLDSTILISDTVLPIKLIRLSNYSDVFTVLANSKKRLPIKVLKHMKDMVHEFVKSTEPKSRVVVSDSLEEISDYNSVEFVYGVGLTNKLSMRGIKGIDNRDLHRDIIIDNNWNSESICKALLPTFRNKYFPRFKYLNQAGFLNSDGKLDYDSSVREFTPLFIKNTNEVCQETFLPPETYRSKSTFINDKYDSIEKLFTDKELEVYHKIMFAPMMDSEKLDLESLFAFLRRNIDFLVNSSYGTHYRKLICLFDYLKYSVDTN